MFLPCLSTLLEFHLVFTSLTKLVNVDLHVRDRHGSQAKLLEKICDNALEVGIVDSLDTSLDLLHIFIIITEEVLKCDQLPLNDDFAGDTVSWKPDYAIRDIKGNTRVVEDMGKREVDDRDGVMADVEGALANVLTEEEAHMNGLRVGEEFLVLLVVIGCPKSSAMGVKT